MRTDVEPLHIAKFTRESKFVRHTHGRRMNITDTIPDSRYKLIVVCTNVR